MKCRMNKCTVLKLKEGNKCNVKKLTLEEGMMIAEANQEECRYWKGKIYVKIR